MARPIKYSHNQDYFDIPNLINCSLAGRIATDGCILDNKEFSYKVAIKDEYIIDEIIKELNYTGNKFTNTQISKTRNNNRTAYVRINSFHKNAENLEKHFNITPRKSLTLQPPNLNNNYLKLAFFIGAIDGDGHIVRVKRKYKGSCLPCISICSASQDFIIWIKKLIDDNFTYKYNKNSTNLQLDKRIKENHHNVYKYTITGLRAAIIIDYLSQFPVPKLARKWQNPEVLDYITIKKLKYPHLFQTLNQEEIAPLLPK